ncbi:MAG: winged helix-turn-helix domain-containing protein [Roseomonas sp.]|nr:winged helix-turn-helix domain-containing protein [Roseomonas sp.]
MLDSVRGEVIAADGSRTVLRAKTLALLNLLLEHAGQLLSQDEILDRVWPNVTVAPASVTQCISELRHALGATDAEMLKTLPRRGYVLDTAPELEAAGSQALSVPARPAMGAAGPAMPVQSQGAAPAQPLRRVVTVEGAPVVAVLPFRVAAAQGADLMAEGIVEDIVHILAGMREPAVISTNSTRRFRNQDDLDLPELAARLGANYLVTGNVRRRGETTQIAVELTEASQGAVIWSRMLEVPDTSLFAAQADIAASIAHALVPWLNHSELRATHRRVPEDLSAYHLLLRARDLLFEFNYAQFEEAGSILRRASERDPHYAPIYAALIEWYCYKIFQGWSANREADIEGMDRAALDAFARDPSHSRALALYGHNRTIIWRNYDEALDLIDRAVEAGPNDAETLIWSSPTLAYVGRTDEAVKRAQRAITLSPQDPRMFRFEHFLSIAHYAAGDLENAARRGLSSAKLRPDFTSNLRITVAALAGLGRFQEASPLVERLMKLQPNLRVGESLPRFAFRDQSMRERHARWLRLAGVPG